MLLIERIINHSTLILQRGNIKPCLLSFVKFFNLYILPHSGNQYSLSNIIILLHCKSVSVQANILSLTYTSFPIQERIGASISKNLPIQGRNMIANNALKRPTLVHGKHDLVEDTTISLYQGSDFIICLCLKNLW